MNQLRIPIHHLLVHVYERDVRILGIDLKTSVIEECQLIARRLGCDGLEFRAADITDIEPDGPVDLVVSLHACDTATDVALARAVTWKAKTILSVPCCHHEFAAQMNHELLPSVHGHGILHERFAELTTDAYRSQMLESCGYRSQVMEFIDLEHTPRNILIRALRKPNARRDHELRSAADAMVKQLGVQSPTLAKLMDE